MRRRTLLGTIAGAAFANADLTRAARAQSAGITLNVWSWQVVQAPIYQKIFEIYERETPGVRIAYRGIASTEYPTVLKTGLSGPGGPDLVMLHPYKSIAPYVRAGQLAPLDEAGIAEVKNFSPESLAAARLDGKLWGLPFARQTIQIFYSRKLFAQLGVVPPTTADQMAPLLDKIAAAGITPIAATGKDAWQLVNVFDALVGNTYGGKAFIAKILAGTATFTDPAMVAALAEFQGLAKYFPKFVSGVSNADARAMFATGRAAMFPGGSWELAGFQNAGMGADVGVFSMPAAQGNPGGHAPTWGYEDGSLGISARAAQPAAALALLRWMATRQFGQAFTDQLKQPSSVSGVVATDPTLSQMSANYAANPVPMIWVTDYFGLASPAPYAALMNAAQNLLTSATTPAAAAASIAQSVVEWTAMNQ
jgi:raffinose/stachyose/melibiose transport system substrate-binding protein